MEILDHPEDAPYEDEGAHSKENPQMAPPPHNLARQVAYATIVVVTGGSCCASLAPVEQQRRGDEEVKHDDLDKQAGDYDPFADLVQRRRPRHLDTASRRPHAKTRNGCKNCKTRKVKCDEKTPACGNYIKHNVLCEFLTSTRGLPVLSVHAQPPPPPQGLNMQDLELLHNYTTRTYATLSESLILRDFYRTTALQCGLKEEYIMRTLLSVSAAHMAYHRTERQGHYQSLAMSHHQIAAKTAMELMKTTMTTPSQAESLFLFSVLTIYFALGCPRRDDNKFLLVGESGFPDWMFLLQGTKAFVTMARGGVGIDGGALAPLFSHGAPDEARRAIEELQKSFYVLELEADGDARVPRCGITDAFVWIFEVAADFLPLLRDGTQEAVAIFSFFAVFLHKAGSQWCLRGWADHLIGRCYGLLDEEHRSWIQWPLEEMGWIP
ncbi:C6 zinc finger protein [Apiospora phragmitis]|uniref:C6 zinc finger protein n=1 Tax=Apiospora phragmitis TaxID=2905665 RepID=A0ABR1WSG5_9PEZI